MLEVFTFLLHLLSLTWFSDPIDERTPSPGEEGVRLPFAELAQGCARSFAKTPMLYWNEL